MWLSEYTTHRTTAAEVGKRRNFQQPAVAPSQRNFWPVPLLVLGELCPTETARAGGRSCGTDTPPMLSASRKAFQLLSSSNPVRRMGDSASKVISAEESLPGRMEPISVAGKTARALGMRAEPAHCALPEEALRGLGRVPGRGLRVRELAASTYPPSLLPSPKPGRGGSSAG